MNVNIKDLDLYDVKSCLDEHSFLGIKIFISITTPNLWSPIYLWHFICDKMSVRVALLLHHGNQCQTEIEEKQAGNSKKKNLCKSWTVQYRLNIMIIIICEYFITSNCCELQTFFWPNEKHMKAVKLAT